VPDVDAAAVPVALSAGPRPMSVLAGARHVLVLRLDNAGDVILAGPTVRGLRASLPGARITLLASPDGSAAGELLPWVDDIVTWRAVWQDAAGAMPFDPEREADAIDRLRSLHADAALILTSFSQTPFAAAYACYLAGIPIRVGHGALFGGSVLSHPVAGPAPEHQADRNLHLLGGIGVPVSDRRLEASVPAEARLSARRMMSDLGVDPGDPIVIVPGASCGARRYAAEGFGRAAAGMHAATGRAIVILGTPGSGRSPPRSSPPSRMRPTWWVGRHWLRRPRSSSPRVSWSPTTRSRCTLRMRSVARSSRSTRAPTARSSGRRATHAASSSECRRPAPRAVCSSARSRVTRAWRSILRWQSKLQSACSSQAGRPAPSSGPIVSSQGCVSGAMLAASMRSETTRASASRPTYPLIA
jgi:hypothetical protein